MTPPKKALCPHCEREVSTTIVGKFRKHDGKLKGVECPQSGQFASADSWAPEGVPDEEGVEGWTEKYPVCPECGRRPAKEKDGTLRLHMREQHSTLRCPMSGKQLGDLSTPTDLSGRSAPTDSLATPSASQPSTPVQPVVSAATAAAAHALARESSIGVTSTGNSKTKSDAEKSRPTATASPLVTRTRSAPADPLEDETRPPPGEDDFVYTFDADSPQGKVVERQLAENLAAQQLAAYGGGMLTGPMSPRYNTGWQYAAFQQPGPVEAVIELDDGRMIAGQADMSTGGHGTFTPYPTPPDMPPIISAWTEEIGPQPLTDSITGARSEVTAPLGGAAVKIVNLSSDGVVEFPAPSFQQPGPAGAQRSPKVDMTPEAQQIADTMKAIFFAHAQTGRSAQHHLGPSEHGTPCDRRLVMRLLGMQPVNPGGDGWAAFVGTCVHAGLAEIFTQVSGTSGRFAVEMPITFPSTTVPRGTGDLLDRVFFCFDDHKVMGEWSINKLKQNGPSETYRKQVQTYAYGASIAGEKIEKVAIIAWPRTSSSLDDLFVWCEPYDPSVGRDSLKRVDLLAAEVQHRIAGGDSPAQIAADAPIDNSDCKFCPFHKPNAVDIVNGCNGKKAK